MKSLTLPACAKINLGLRILRKRPDGFHDLETVFLRIGWKDDLTFLVSDDDLAARSASERPQVSGLHASERPQVSGFHSSERPQVSMTSSHPELPVDSSNLCIQAAQSFFAGHPPSHSISSLAIHLQKNIPFGAGLGGGSSDAATVLKACSILTSAPESKLLLEMAASLGSDVPFFLQKQTAYGTGRGEVLTDMPFPRALDGAYLVVAVPDARVSTAEAYQHVVPTDSHVSDLREVVSLGKLEDWAQFVTNDFEESVFKAYPIVAQLKHQMQDCGAKFALMSGSGSSVFGVFQSSTEASQAASELARRWPHFSYWTGPAAQP